MSCYTDGMECPKCYCIPCNCASTPAPSPAPVRGDETTMTDWRVRPGRLTWAEARSILLQGTAIQQDYAAGRYVSYEDFSARMDAAAREIVEGSPFAEPEATPKDHPLSAAARASGDAETREDA